MKHGRRPVRKDVKKLIMETFSNKKVPLNPNQITRIIEKDYNKKYNYKTVSKYVKELKKTGRLEIKLKTISKNNQEFIYYYPKS